MSTYLPNSPNNMTLETMKVELKRLLGKYTLIKVRKVMDQVAKVSYLALMSILVILMIGPT
jgi:hypothetical protein